MWPSSTHCKRSLEEALDGRLNNLNKTQVTKTYAQTPRQEEINQAEEVRPSIVGSTEG
jgi:hypothetical protein